MAQRSPFEEILCREEEKIEWFSRRLYLIEAVQNDLMSVICGKRFTICNDIIWMMVLDVRDIFVIHFASWVRGIFEQGTHAP